MTITNYIYRLFNRGIKNPPGTIRLYYLGLPKTGSNSLTMLLNRYPSNHEFLFGESVYNIWKWHNKQLSQQEWLGFIRSRDNVRGLTADISTFNHYFIPELDLIEGPKKYIFCYRDCYSWINSFLGHMLFAFKTETIYPWHEHYIEVVFGDLSDKNDYLSEENLRRKIPVLIPALINYWIENNQKVLSFIEDKNALVLETGELSDCRSKLASFLNVNPSFIELSRSHENKARYEIDWIEPHVDIFSAYQQQIEMLYNKLREKSSPQLQRELK